MHAREKLTHHGLYDPRFEHDSCGVGFVCNIKGAQSNEIIRQGLEVLNRLSHRGATGADPKTGDGAGILIQIPHDFFVKIAQEAKIKLPSLGSYGSGLVFLPTDKGEYQYCKDIFNAAVVQYGQKILGWRQVPVDNADIGKTAQESQPCIEQVFIAKDNSLKEQLDFERKLYLSASKLKIQSAAAHYARSHSFILPIFPAALSPIRACLCPDKWINSSLILKMIH